MTAKNKIINVLPYELNLHALIFRIPLNQFRYILKSGIKVQSVKSILQYFRFLAKSCHYRNLRAGTGLKFRTGFKFLPKYSRQPPTSTRTLFTNTRSKWSSETESKYELCGDSTSSWNEMPLFFFGWVSFIFSYINAAIWINFEFHLKKLGNIDILYFPWSNFSIPIMESPIKI